MSRYDRLSALMQHFQMSVEMAEPGTGNLIFYGGRSAKTPCAVEFWPSVRAAPSDIPMERRLIEARADWGGESNPLVAALPERLVMETSGDDNSALLLQMVVAEAHDARCGSASALNRLCEVLLIRLLRQQIERGATNPGLLAGLSNPRLSRALVVMHDKPGRNWRNGELAEIAGMSLSRFSEQFAEQVGETPQSYLRRWRMTLARQDIASGERVQSVARRLGYGSPEALSRAFNKHYGKAPVSVRRESRDLASP
ncbi:AraC family transcriptional regulator [Hoeflea prorocentri]|uniref:AraC family transcriptional regulator n=1 Tax=Hoeflea prorocentri TaxID=1922333 RepID=A0A9X3ZJZ9_9HYPH|nr:AraC family transcriptional regulator [Hoeflea prorocentri]MCY6383340.1 AraC family transcriptional regulator [Hoeflea prorocentri]MDA5401140.1 AraC family transcriptional regulator [Hoeflea prorocentri]